MRACAAAAVALSLAAAIPIKRECLSKMSVIAGAEVAGSTAFDWTDEAVKEFHSQSVPVLKRSCLNDSGILNSFRMVI